MSLQTSVKVDESTDDALEEAFGTDGLPIDYQEILADFEPGAPGGVIVFSTCGYATDEEADVAHEAFLREVLEAPDEDV